MEAAKVHNDWDEWKPDEDVTYDHVQPIIKSEPQEQKIDSIYENSYADIQSVSTAVVSRRLNQPNRFNHADGIQYIDRHFDGEPLPYSAKFFLDSMVCDLMGERCLLCIGLDYILKVSVGQIDKINDAVSFDEALKVLLNHVKVERVLLDMDSETCNEAARNTTERLRTASSSALECRMSADQLFQVFKIFEKQSPTESMVQEIQANMFIEEILKKNLLDYLEVLVKLKIRDTSLNAVTDNKQLQSNTRENLIMDSIQVLVESYKKQLRTNYPSKLTEKFAKIKPILCFYVSKTDRELFSDLENILTEWPFHETFNMIRGNYIMRLTNAKVDSLQNRKSLSNHIYFFILKSIMDLSKELHNTYNIHEVVSCGDSGWVCKDLSDDRNLLKSSLLQQTKMLVKLANHYAPGAKTVNQKYPHTFYLKNVKTDDINEYVWSCFLDGSIEHIFSAIPSHVHLFSDPINFYTDYVSRGNFRNASSEFLRTITYHLLQFLRHAGAIMTSSTENSMNMKILKNQISAIRNHDVTIEELRDLLEIFSHHWKQCSSVLKNISDRLNGNIFNEYIISIEKMLSEIVSCALAKKNVKHLELIDFLRMFYDFCINFEHVDLKWYVRIQTGKYMKIFMNNNLIQPVNNKWKGTVHECYVVKNVDGFKDAYTSYVDDDVDLPKHYQMVVIQTLLENVKSLEVKKHWNGGRNLTEGDQLNVMKMFISAISSLFPYLNEQPDYIEFETYIHDNVQPLVNAIDKSRSSEEFNKRISQVKESFWYIRNQSNIGIDDALKLFQDENESFNEEILKTTYHLYKACFEDYIKESLPLDHDAKSEIIVKKVLSLTASQLATTWSNGFKRKTLPKILAGLAAAWSILFSKYITSSGMYLKPHIIQIICILRMLSVDQSAKGVAKHLAQVLTGQGKSVILGLSATLLALFGHNVEVICYSNYLAQRDADDFKEMFELFKVSDRISYKTFKHMVDSQIDVYAQSGEDYIYRTIGLSNPSTQNNRKQAQVNLTNSVILIDEVDIFFLDIFYGNTGSRMFLPVVEGLGEIQIKVWEIVKSGNTDPSSITAIIEDCINTTVNPKVRNLKAFIDRPGTYTILDENRDKLSEVQVTNRILFMNHLYMMITAANNINLEPIDGPFFSSFKLDKEGRITVRSSLGEFTLTLRRGYNNTFAYFKLKGSDFMQHVNDTTNFGYFMISIAALSYAKLPEMYPLILGVTGTLTGLNSYEKNAVENHYNIRHFSIMPSFFGSMNLNFNEVNDFKCMPTEEVWMKAVLSSINTIINANRSVLVFFETELNIKKFMKDFASHLDRLNILTVNTEAETKEQYINDAGVVKTVTLTTREMGRGVDFKSGATVEENGGVHVIQTFFSLDVKEEIQIKGRTARKDHRGSYEQIICIEHLEKLQLLTAGTTCDSVSYAQLENARKSFVEENGDEKAKKLAASDAKHAMTVTFYSQLERDTTSAQKIVPIMRLENHEDKQQED